MRTKMTPGQQLLTFKQRLLNAVAASKGSKHEEDKELENDEENEKVSTETAIVEDAPKQQQKVMCFYSIYFSKR